MTHAASIALDNGVRPLMIARNRKVLRLYAHSMRESNEHSTFQGRERSVFNQTNIGTVSRPTLGRLLRHGAERVWAFPSAAMPS